MKKSICLILMAFIICSCHDKLEIEPRSAVSSGNMWQNPDDAKGAMHGMYNQFRSAMNRPGMFEWGDLRTGFYTFGSRYLELELNQNIPNPSTTGTNWEKLYTLINDCNLILKYVPKIEFSITEDKDYILANAFFLRAIAYFYIVRLWGDAPLLIDGFEAADQEGLEPIRDPASELYKLIESDIESALNLIPSKSKDILFASKAAINMLKTEFHVWFARKENGGVQHLEKARAAIDEVLASNYKLENNYETVFRNETNNEIIFSIRFLRDEGPPNEYGREFLWPEQFLPLLSLANNPIPVRSHALTHVFTDEHVDFLFANPDDTRASVNCGIYYHNGTRIWPWINKYLGEWIDGARYHTSDTRFYRFAEAILYKAEIENALGDQIEALLYLNIIAKRAYGDDIHYSGSYSQEELDEIILDERLKELCTEGKQWFDLLRFGKVFERVWSLQGRENEEGILLWPISQTTINLNPKIKQNPGY